MKKVLFTLISCIFFSSCGEEEQVSNIPTYAVNLMIEPSGIDNHLSIVGNIGIYVSDKAAYEKLLNDIKGVKVHTAPRLKGEAIGFSGLLLIKTDMELAAFDLCCPNEIEQRIKVVPTNESMTAKCPECASEFNLWENGRAVGGPAEKKRQSLKSYRVLPQNGKFRIVN